MLFSFLLYLYGLLPFYNKNDTQTCLASTYSPDVCTAMSYKFTFIFDSRANQFKTHGVWISFCEEAPQEGWPSCCNLKNITYTEPDDPTNFIATKWYNTTAKEDCTNNRKVSLFDHEFYKHASCSDDMRTTDSFLNKAIELYDKYYEKYVNGQCQGYDQIWLDLDGDYNYLNTTCVE